MKIKFIILIIIIFHDAEGFGKLNNSFTKVKVTPQPQVTKLHLIFMNHLDVGYTDMLVNLPGFSANVINTYFHVHYPKAINIARQIRNSGYVERFRYTTHPWLLSFFLHCPKNTRLANINIQCPTAIERANMVQAIKDGDILWHDGPMNMNYENLNKFGLNVALNISANLNLEFGIKKPIRVVSLRDVTGLTRGAIRHLLNNNVVGISSGVNKFSAPPSLPPLCRWRAAARSVDEENIPEIVYMQNALSYPDPPGPNPNSPGGLSLNNCFQAPGSSESLCFMFRIDNMGPPQSVQEVLDAYEILRAQYVNAKLVASTFEDFFAVLWKNKHLLPLIDREIGDTWIQGTSSDPKKFARFRAMQREFQFYYESGYPITADVVDASRFLIKPAEHTYGLSDCGDSINWRNDQFSKIRNNPGMVAEELSWVEQRQYEQLVLDILGPTHVLTIKILNAFKEMESMVDFQGTKYELIYQRTKHDQSAPSFNFTCSNGTHSIEVGFQDESISYLTANNILITPDHVLGKLMYHTYNETDTDFFLDHYKTFWNTGLGKPNSTINAHPESKEWKLSAKSFYKSTDNDCRFFVIVSPDNSSATTYYGFPEKVYVLWNISITDEQISTEVFWMDKSPTRLMESISFRFSPKAMNNAYQYYFSKIGEAISPYSVLLNGSQWQHSVDDNGVFIATSPEDKPIFRVIPWDTGIACPITSLYGPTVWPAPLSPITDALTGVAFNFYNNIWNTNYIYWYPFGGYETDSDKFFKARFLTELSFQFTNVDDSLRYN